MLRDQSKSVQPSDLGSDKCTNDNFWEPHKYSSTVKRVENANKLCTELALIIQERSEIEKAYSANLRKFASRIDSFVRTGLEYGTGVNILLGFSKESEDIAALHSDIAVNLIDSVQSGIRQWQKKNFHKVSISSIKEAKTLSSEFENAQKTWYNRNRQVTQCKKNYFSACRSVRSLQVQVQNAKNEPFGTSEQQSARTKEAIEKRLRKLEEKLRKATADEKKTRKAYEDALSSLSDVTPSYVKEMTQVFNKAQEFERERINYFKQQALLMQQVLDVSIKPNLSQIYADMKEAISRVLADADLKQWSLTHGVDMPANFPVFQEYSPELYALGKKNKSSVADGGSAGVTLTGIKSITSPDRIAHDDVASNASAVAPSPSHGYSSMLNGAMTGTQNDAPSADVTGAYAEFVDDGAPGVPVRALYDYNSEEPDELSFRTDDLFEKLGEEDDQGWCKGRKDGRVGLYPANYVQVA